MTPRHGLRPARAVLAAILAAGALCGVTAPARAADELAQLEKSFKRAIDRVLPATVVCTSPGRGNLAPGSSGVIVSRKGFVLSDGDVGSVLRRVGKEIKRSQYDTVEVRLPNLREGGFTKYEARVIHRNKDLDTSLLRITNPPRGGFPQFLTPATSAQLRVGTFIFAAGNAFGMTDETPPSLTAGVVASLPPLRDGDPGGPHELIYTSAAVNPGVNGGPLVDVSGYLVGTISSYVTPGPDDPYQFLGRVVPMDRIRAAYADTPEFRKVFPRRSLPTASGIESAVRMQTAFHHTARGAHPHVVSLEVTRKSEVLYQLPVGGKMMKLPRYQGPVSGVLVSKDGTVVTSLYNLTNLSPLLYPGWDRNAPPEAKVGGGLGAIEKVAAYFSGGESAGYEVAAYHEGLGIAVLRPTGPAAARVRRVLAALPALEPAPPDAFRAGRFVLALGNPFGSARKPDPLLTTGILSKLHAPGDSKWSGLWQTDAGVTDGNCGGAAVDLRGRLLGVLTLWDPIRHGRNSGVGFIVPWEKIARALPELSAGRTFARPLVGVSWDLAPGETGAPDLSGPARIKAIVEDSAANEAGLLPGDVIVAFDGEEMKSIAACSTFLRDKWSGDVVKVTLRRGAEQVDVHVTLGIRP